MAKKIKTAELFSGSKSFSNYAKKLNYETLTFDNVEKYNPDVCIDINLLDPYHKDLKNLYFLWMSPPCEKFSVCTIGRNWNYDLTPKTQETKNALQLLEHTIKIIAITKPKYWVIENPRGMMRKVIPKLFEKYKLDFHRETVTYCQYGDNRMKPTDLFTNIKSFKGKKCKNGDSCHIASPRGSKTGTQALKSAYDRSKIPEQLFKEIFESIR